MHVVYIGRNENEQARFIDMCKSITLIRRAICFHSLNDFIEKEKGRDRPELIFLSLDNKENNIEKLAECVGVRWL